MTDIEIVERASAASAKNNKLVHGFQRVEYSDRLKNQDYQHFSTGD